MEESAGDLFALLIFILAALSCSFIYLLNEFKNLTNITKKCFCVLSEIIDEKEKITRSEASMMRNQMLIISQTSLKTYSLLDNILSADDREIEKKAQALREALNKKDDNI